MKKLRDKRLEWKIKKKRAIVCVCVCACLCVSVCMWMWVYVGDAEKDAERAETLCIRQEICLP